jgi:hypothetical protein
MDRFSRSEPHRVLVIWDDEDDELHWASTSDMRDWDKIGLLETCKLCIGVKNGTNVVDEADTEE